jgi:hypothetical protein
MESLLLVFSHVLAFSVLFVDSLFDFLNNNDIPDEFAVAGITGGVLLHAAQTYTTGSMEPLIWSLGVGSVFLGYGWLAYWRGLWGGADALVLGTVGFAAPGPVTGTFGFSYILDFVFNLMVAAYAVTVTFGIYKFRQQSGTLEVLKDDILENERLIAGSVLATGLLSSLLVVQGMNGFIFFALMVTLIFLYRFLKVVQEEYMVREVDVDNLEGGEVPAPGQGFGRKIKGLTQEDIESIDEDMIEVRSGVPFIPVFLVALVLTDVTVSGMWMLYALY